MTRITTLLLVCLALTAGCSFLAPNPDSFSSHHYYSVGVVLVIVGLVSVIPVVGLSIGEWQAA